jgi:hypothetical protein
MSGETFAEHAARLAVPAALLLGWRPDEFRRARPSELTRLLQALRGDEGAAGVDSAELARLRGMFPDQPPPSC